jgi:hypothetical protein
MWACPALSEMTIQQRTEANSCNSPIKHNYAKVNGIRLHYAESGNGAVIFSTVRLESGLVRPPSPGHKCPF